MGIVRIISRLIVGLVFTFSGFVKCIDPLGTAYKINDYLDHFELDGLMDYSLILAILMCGVELLIGLMLLSKSQFRLAAWLSLIFMAFYTPLTLYLALFNPVTDCGCFGDALVITNWQTFFKNLILVILAIIIFVYRKDYGELFSPIYRFGFTLLLVVLVFGFELFSLDRLPIIDFRPYKIGVNIQEGMEVPEDAPQGVTEHIFTYEKDGQKAEFNINNIPTEGWTYVDRKDIIISEGYEPPIHDFSITTLSSIDITDEVLNSGYVCLLIAYDLNESDTTFLSTINKLASIVQETGNRFIGLTGSGPGEINNFREKYQTAFEFCTTDKTALKTIIRSNPGLLIMKNGTILNKWHVNHLPTIEELLSEIQLVEF